MTEEESFAEIFEGTRVIAVVGLSSKPDRPSNDVAAYLQRAGYRIIPVNPAENEVLGERAYPSLLDLPEDLHVDMVDVFRRAEDTPEVAEQAARIGAEVLWLQLGISNDDARRIGEDAGMTVVMDRCTKIEHRRLNREVTP